MWHIVSAKPDASLLLGLKPGSTKESFLPPWKSKLLKNLFQRHSVQAGDTFLSCKNSAHDWPKHGRLRSAAIFGPHVSRVTITDAPIRPASRANFTSKKALAVTNFNGGIVERVPRVALPTQRGTRALLAACPYFATERAGVRRPLRLLHQQRRASNFSSY